ncbi:MAG: hypothetical protein H0V86_09285 [Chloroflexia bacterium]|nr:hypothetical protein [Chloroflexia bacterium]
MRNIGKLSLGIALAAMLAALVVGAGVAQGAGDARGGVYERFVAKVAARLGKQPDEVHAAIVAAQGEIADEEVAAGRIPEKRGARIKERAREGRGLGLGVHKGHGHLIGRVTKVSGDTLTIETSRDTKTVRLGKDATVRGPKGAKGGKVTVGSYVRVTGKADSKGVIAAQTVRVMPPMQGIRRAFHDGQAQVAAFLDITPDQFRAQLRAGKSLGEIAGPKRTPELQKLLVHEAGKRVDDAVKAGYLDEKRAAKIREHLPKWAEKVVTRERGMGRHEGHGKSDED